MPPKQNPAQDTGTMTSRATSAFKATVRRQLHERASDYVMWVAGHGGDAATVNAYLDSVRVFPSHFDEWTATMGRDLLIASIPVLRTLMPGFTGGEIDAASVPMPPLIEKVVALAIQQHIMARATDPVRFSAFGTENLSGFHAPTLEVDFATIQNHLSRLPSPSSHVELLASNFGVFTNDTKKF